MLLERVRVGCGLLSCEYKAVLEKYLTFACYGTSVYTNSWQCQVTGNVTSNDNDGMPTWKLTAHSLKRMNGHAGKHDTTTPKPSISSQSNGLVSKKHCSRFASENQSTGSCVITKHPLRTVSELGDRRPWLFLPKISHNTALRRLSSSSVRTGNGFTYTHYHIVPEHQSISFRALNKSGHSLALLYNQRSSYMSETEETCWNCQKHVRIELLFCATCKAIQPPDPTKDYFQVMNSERTFAVDIKKLQERYRNLQRLLHPDYFSQKSQKERDLSEMQSSLVNKAYRTLLTPLSRGLYLLKLHGFNVGEGTDSDVEMPFIFEVMELNEKLEEAHDQSAVQDIGNFVDAKYEELTEEVGKAFEKGDFEEAKLLLIQMKYFSNIQEKVKIRNMPS